MEAQSTSAPPSYDMAPAIDGGRAQRVGDPVPSWLEMVRESIDHEAACTPERRARLGYCCPAERRYWSGVLHGTVIPDMLRDAVVRDEVLRRRSQLALDYVVPGELLTSEPDQVRAAAGILCGLGLAVLMWSVIGIAAALIWRYWP